MMVGFLGTFPRFLRINAKFLEKEWFVFFAPVRLHRTRLAEATQIETDVEERREIDGYPLSAWYWAGQDLLAILGAGLAHFLGCGRIQTLAADGI